MDTVPAHTALIDNTNTVEFEVMTDDVTSAPVTDATTTYTLYDHRHIAVTGATTISMPHVSGGTYRGVLAHTVTLEERDDYVVVVTATSGGFQYQGERNIRVKYREA